MRILSFIPASVLILAALPAWAQLGGSPVTTQVPSQGTSTITETARKQAETSTRDAAPATEARKDKPAEADGKKDDAAPGAPSGTNR
jgi:hypothetical protein